MGVDRFDRGRFERALPSGPLEEPLWEGPMVEQGEYTYLVPVLGQPPLAIKVRSSVESGTGWSSRTGENSIRCWLIDQQTGEPWGSKVSRWTTRVPKWEGRLLGVLRELWKMALMTHPCSECGVLMKIFKVRKGEMQRKNKGRLFLKCTHGCGEFEWLDIRRERS